MVEQLQNNSSLLPNAAYRLGRLMPMALVSSGSVACLVPTCPEDLEGAVRALSASNCHTRGHGLPPGVKKACRALIEPVYFIVPFDTENPSCWLVRRSRRWTGGIQKENGVAKLKDKVAVITGETSGMALATARLFVEEGAHVLSPAAAKNRWTMRQGDRPERHRRAGRCRQPCGSRPPVRDGEEGKGPDRCPLRQARALASSRRSAR